MIIGYTTGVFDMFHIGHLNVIKNAKANCDYLIVGVTTDEVVEQNKNKTPIIPYDARAAIVEAIKYVDQVIPKERYDIQGKVETVVNNHIDRKGYERIINQSIRHSNFHKVWNKDY